MKHIDEEQINEQPILEEDQTEKPNKMQNKKKPNKMQNKKKPQIGHLLSGLAGGVVSALIVVLLFTNQLIPINDTQMGEVALDSNDTPVATNMATKNMDDSVNIDDISKAIVGVSNLQQQDVWQSNEEAGIGSGIIYKKENGKAYVITNNHVVKGASEVIVNINEEDEEKATVLGTDALSDLALLEINGSKIDTVAELGSSNDLRVGETVFAIGNPLSMDFSGSVTKGIISGLNRPVKVDTTGNRQADWISEVIQTDAAINPGNSGGALIDTAGEVIGINSMKIAQQSVEGIGFSIPIDAALPIIDQLKKQGEVVRPFIGISMVELNQVPDQYKSKVTVPENIKAGVVIANVEASSPAEEAGIQQFDVITKINDETITSALDLRKYMYSETVINDTIQIELYRNGKIVKTTLKLAERSS